MNRVKLVTLSKEHTIAFKEEMQEAFQYGFQTYHRDDKSNQWQVLPDKDFYQALNAEGAEAYEVMDAGGQRVGGAIIVVNHETRHNELAFLYVKVGVQGKGLGQSIWKAIEALHSETEVWETCTPYFDLRNVHFYINCCGFHAVEFFNAHLPICTCPNSLIRRMDCSGSRNTNDFHRTHVNYLATKKLSTCKKLETKVFD